MRKNDRLVLTCALAAILVVLSGGNRANAQDERPNFILFIADDVSWNDIGCYGNEFARTPNIDRLAEGGVRFDHAYLTASSCSPSRCSIITGRYPHNNGAAAELHAPLPSHLVQFPSLLRSAGYYTALSGKHHIPQETSRDGERVPPFDVIDGGRIDGNSGGHGKWLDVLSECPGDKPFFLWFASYDAHRGWDADRQWSEEEFGPIHRPEEVVVPPFLVDDDETRRDLASYYNEVTRFDYFIGQVVDELERTDRLDNTFIMVMADNGRPFPRAKTRLHDSGMKTPFVVHWPEGIKADAGSNCKSLVSVIDIAPTVLELAGVEPIPSLQGFSFSKLLDDPTSTIREVCFSEHNWHDYEAYGRSVRNGEWMYITNGRPYLAWQGPADSVRSPSHLSLQRLRDADDLTEAQADVFLSPRRSEELYRVSDDPHQLRNLVDDPEAQEMLNRLREEMRQWQERTGDTLPEQLSRDQFDRETGKSLGPREEIRGTTPGTERDAAKINRR